MIKSACFAVGKLTTPLAVVLLLINFGFLCWYLFFGYQKSFHSDSAVKVLLAREIVVALDYFPADWNYVNKDLFVLFGHSFIIPLLAFMPAGFTTHALSGLISSVLILSGIWFLTGMAPLGIARRLLIVAIVAAGLSEFAAENLFGQISYGTVIYFSCYIMFFSWRFIDAIFCKKILFGFALFFTIVLAFWANPQRALVSYVFPLLIAILVLWILRRNILKKIQVKSICFLIGIVFAGVVFGVLLHIQTISSVNSVQEVGHARWLSYDLIIRNFIQFFGWFFYVFGGLPSVDNIVFSVDGIYEACRFILVFLVLLLIPIAIFRIFKSREDGLVIFGVFTLAILIIFPFLLITTSIPNMGDPFSGARYLVPAFVFALVLVLLQPVDFKNDFFFGIAVTFISILFLFSAFSSFGVNKQNSNPRNTLVDFMAINNLRYGFGTYWNAGVVSVLSNEKTLVRQIIIDRGIPLPMRHLSSDRWYRPNTWQGETFLLLTSQEVKNINFSLLESYGVKPNRELVIGDYKIYTFSENIAKKLPGWDTRYEVPTKFLPMNGLSQTGHLVEDVGGQGAMLVAEKGQSGALHYGPYVDVDAGRYRVTFDITAERQSVPVVRLDVAAAPDQKIFGELTLDVSDAPQEIIFSLNEKRTMEFRVWALGSGKVILRGVSLERIGN